MENQRNLIMAVILTGLLLFGWDYGVRYFYPPVPKPAVSQAAPGAPAAADPAPVAGDPATATGEPASKKTREGGLTSPTDVAAEERDLKTALSGGNRVPVVAPGLTGSINLKGAMVDDLSTVRHTAKVEKDSGPQRILAPRGTLEQNFAQFGWAGQNVELPSDGTIWTVPQGAKLTPQSPVTLTWANSTGQTFSITYAIDADYMITATQTIANNGGQAVTVEPLALINRTDKTAALDSFNVHAGPIGAFDEAVDFELDYKESCFLFWCGKGLQEEKVVQNEGKADWIGFTDVYWMALLVPDKPLDKSYFSVVGTGLYEAKLAYGPINVAPGQQTSHTTRLFAGAKEVEVLDRYQAAGIPNFSLAIDWGWFRWFEKPMFWLLHKLFELIGNFGVAIMLLTLIVRGVMFPIAQKQFASMAAMRAIQPKMKAIQERYADDKQKQQQEVMELYKREKVNPLAGCLPIFLQIPIFFALYKVLIVVVEMRHQPFYLWIKDLSAPDPLHILNLFGLLDFTVPSFLGIGILAVLLGITMWAQFKLNPSSPDPVQQQVFAIMPWIMMFIMAPFAAGLLIYWITSNLLTILQQWYLYSKHPQLKAMADKEAEDAKRAKA